MKKGILILIVFNCILDSGFCQKNLTDTIIHLNDVEVNSTKIGYYKKQLSIQTIDTSLLQIYSYQSLSALLRSTTGVSVRSYGASGISSMSIRGGGYSHTTVLWNDLNIQNPMNAGVNLSSLPVLFSDVVLVQYGGAGALNGSGSMSGALHLSSGNVIDREEGITTGISIGSHDLSTIDGISGFIAAKAGNKKYGLSVKLYGKNAENDFKFRNTAAFGKPYQHQTNSEMYHYAGGLDQEIRISDRFISNTSILYTDYFTQVPTTMDRTSASESNQTDRNLLATTKLKYIGTKGSFLYKFGYLYSETNFKNPEFSDSISGSSVSSAQSIINEIEKKWYYDHQNVTIGFNYTDEQASAQELADNPVRNRLTGYFLYNISLWRDRITSYLQVRKETSNGTAFPYVYSVGTAFKVMDDILLTGNYSTTYRIPSFNDLYWKDGWSSGNIHLKPETGWSGDLGIKCNVLGNVHQFTISQTVFINHYSDYISWLPDSLGTWSPTNKNSGESYGYELLSTDRFQINGFFLELMGSYFYTRSTISSNDEYNDKPMIYVPRHKASGSVSLARGSVAGRVLLNYTGSRYYDYKHILDGYLLTDVILNFHTKVKNFELLTSVQINNLFNTNYQVMAWYAMPMRNYSIDLKIKL